MKVQVCSLKSEDFKYNLTNSLISAGFAVITDHDIDFGLIRRAQDEWRNFFKKEESYKKLFVNGNDSNLGYKGMGSEKAVGAKVSDLKQFFHWKPMEEIPPNVADFTANLFFELEELGMKVLSVLDEAIGTNYKEDCLDSEKTLFRALYYPALAEVAGAESNAVRASAHEDLNYITLLVAASAPGLEVKDNEGKWHKVPFEQNSIVLNAGDMLHLASRGLYKSTTHRVVNPVDSNSDRISMPLFIHPKSNVELSPGYTAAKFLEERLKMIYGEQK